MTARISILALAFGGAAPGLLAPAAFAQQGTEPPPGAAAPQQPLPPTGAPGDTTPRAAEPTAPPSGYGQTPPQGQYAQPPQQGYGQQGQYSEPPPAGGYRDDQYRQPPPRDRYRNRDDGRVEEPPLPPPREEKPEGEGAKIPPWSVRIDPFNWLLQGRLGFELEAAIASFVTVELVPVFVVNDKPPTLNFSGVEDTLRQESNGAGPISGASIGAGFWLGGTPLRGTVLRVIFQNTAYKYKTVNDAGDVDSLTHTDRIFMGMLGSHSRFGAFTIAGGIGLGLDLNKQERCYAASAGQTITVGDPNGKNCGELQLADDKKNRFDVAGWLYPAVLAGRISLGVTFD